MKKLSLLALTALLALPACVTDELSPEELESVEAALDNQFDPVDNSCNVLNPGGHLGPLVNGTKGRDFWCCGEALCIDAKTCGDKYGEYVEACVDCHFFECIPGAESGGGGDGGGLGGTLPPPIYNPPGGGVYAP
jgi:hypothetical protein